VIGSKPLAFSRLAVSQKETKAMRERGFFYLREKHVQRRNCCRDSGVHRKTGALPESSGVEEVERRGPEDGEAPFWQLWRGDAGGGV
jgi:hypothetical protein